MKKYQSIVLILVLLIGMAFTSTVMAQADPSDLAKEHPTKEPGARPTENAILRATEGNGNGNANNNGNGNGNGNSQSAKEEKGKKNKEVVQYRGYILENTGTTLSITLKDSEETVTFAMTGDTVVKVPDLWQCSTCADLLPGMQVIVRASLDETGQLTALIIQVVPGKPTKMHHVGVVTAYQPGASITILAKDGNEYTFLVTAETVILPADSADLLVVGATVTIISPRDVTGQPATAKGIVVHTGTATDGTDTPDVEDTDEPSVEPSETPAVSETPTVDPSVVPSETPTAEPTDVVVTETPGL